MNFAVKKGPFEVCWEVHKNRLKTLMNGSLKMTKLSFITYIFLVTFSVPGSTSLSVLAGFLYPSWLAIFFVCLSSGVGAVMCYQLADAAGRVFVDKYLTDRVEAWRKQTEKNKDDLMSYRKVSLISISKAYKSLENAS